MSEPLEPGLLLGDYEILSSAGSGGMGVVYRARQRALNRIVALKVIRQEISTASDYRERFLREAHLAAAIDHPHVVSVYDVQEATGRLFLAMQWVDGLDLRTIIEREGALEPDRTVLFADQIGGAIDAVHSGGLVHRDLKPANVLLRQVGGRDHTYLTDFGVARAPALSAESLTQTGAVVGTVGYMAPEQIMGQPADARSDMYAMACLVFELMTGKPPFTGENDMALRWAHANGPRPRASLMRPVLGERYDGFFIQALSIDPHDRFQSGRAFANALRSSSGATASPPAAESTTASPETPAAAPATAATAPMQRQPPLAPRAQQPRQTPAPHTPAQPAQEAAGRRRAVAIIAAAAVLGIAAGAAAVIGLKSSAGKKSTDTALGSFFNRSQAGTSATSSTQPSSPVAPSTESAAKAGIGETLSAYQAAYASADVGALGALFSEGVERHGLAASGCSTARGKPSVLAQYSSQFAGGPLNYRLVGLSASSMTLMSSSTAVVHTRYLIVEAQNNTGPISFWLQDLGGRWLITRVDATCHPSH